MSQLATDIGRTNLIELDIPTEGLPIVSKPYTILLKYHDLVEHKVKWLEEAGIILHSMSDLASPIFMVPKKDNHMETTTNIKLTIMANLI